MLVIDTDSLAPRAWGALPGALDGALDGDTVFVEGIGLDTARYQLATDTLAFGLRLERSNTSGANPYSDIQLQLMHVQGSGLRMLAPPLLVRSHHTQWDTHCAGQSLEISRTVAVGPGRHHGLADLVVRERRVTNRSAMEGEYCFVQSTPVETATHVLRYDGQHYPLPEALKPL